MRPPPARIVGLRRAAWIEALVAAKRDRCPALRRPVTWARLRDACLMDGLHLELGDLPIEQPAQLLPFFSRWSILVSDELAPRERVRVAAHELAHVWVHHDPEHERWELVYHAVHPTADDPAEREAEAVAWLLMEGLSELPRLPAVTAPRRAAVQLVPPTPDPYTFPVATTRERRAPRYGGRDGETPLQRALRRTKAAPRPLPMGAPDDADVILYEPGGVVRFVDDEGRRWRVYDVALVPERSVVSLGNTLARYRVFVNALGQRRKYIFRSKWELRDVAARHFARQLREAIDVPVRVEAERRAHSA